MKKIQVSACLDVGLMHYSSYFKAGLTTNSIAASIATHCLPACLRFNQQAKGGISQCSGAIHQNPPLRSHVCM